MKWIFARQKSHNIRRGLWPSSLWRSSLWLLPVLALVGLGINRWQRTELNIASLHPLPQDPFIQVYMNHSQAHRYTEPYRGITRPGQDLEAVILKAIREARSSIDVAVQEFRLPLVAQALVERQRAGVRVRVVMENTYTQPWVDLKPTLQTQLDPRLQQRYQDWRQLVDANGDGQITNSELQQRDVLTILKQGQIPWLDDTADGSKGSRLMHHKFLVIDQHVVIATSANFTLSDTHGDLAAADTRGNANSLVVLKSRELAALFTQEFSYLWGDGPGGKPDSQFGVNKPFRPVQYLQLGQARVAVKFSPSSGQIPWQETTNGLIAKTLDSARQQIHLALFVFSDQELANRLAQLRQRVPELRVLVDPEFIYRNYSEALDLMGLQLPAANSSQPCSYEVGNQPWSSPLQTVGTPNLPKGDKLHHKFAEIDGRTVIVGSHNWSDSGNLGNDEFLLVIEQPLVAAHYAREFDRLYTNSQLGAPRWLSAKVVQQLKSCGQVAVSSPTPERVNISANLNVSVNLKVNLNTATQAQLESLPGIGPRTARAIIAYRQQQPFQSLHDLDAVPGIGPAVIARLVERVTW